jgi:hypothetical protein
MRYIRAMRIVILLIGIGLFCSCQSNKRGFDYKKHHRKTKGKKIRVKDLTQYKCGRTAWIDPIKDCATTGWPIDS